MEKEIVAGAIFLLAFISPTPAPPLPTSQVKQEEMIIYSVEEKDTLGIVAAKHYGSSEFWTNVWNDNSWIEDPDIIEKDWKLKIPEKTGNPEELKKELSEKLAKRQITTAATTQIEAKFVVTGTTGPLNDTQINFLGNCESGMTTGRNSGNGYYGAFQFSPGTWRSMNTGYERADLAPLDIQTEAVQNLLTRSSIWTQFPGCAAKMSTSGLL